MSTNHTPGPLFAVVAKRGGDYAILDSKKNVVAECFEDIRRHCEWARDEAKANAHLYAAAPELLAALVRLKQSYAAIKPPGYPNSDAEKLAEAAIAKAIGIAP